METNENFDHSMIYGMKMKNNKILMESIAKNENHIHRLNILHYEMHDANIYSKLTKNQNTDLLMLKHAIEFYIIKKNIQIESIQTFVFFLVYYVKLINITLEWNLLSNSSEKYSTTVVEEYLLLLLDNDYYIKRETFDMDFLHDLSNIAINISLFDEFQNRYTEIEKYERLSAILYLRILSLERCDILYNQGIIKENDSLYQIILKKTHLLYEGIVLLPVHTLDQNIIQKNNSFYQIILKTANSLYERIVSSPAHTLESDQAKLIKMNYEINKHGEYINNIYHMESAIELKKELHGINDIMRKAVKIDESEKTIEIKIIRELFIELAHKFSTNNKKIQLLIKNTEEYKNYHKLSKELSSLEFELSVRIKTINQLIPTGAKSAQIINYDFNENNNYIKIVRFKINKLQDGILEFALSYENNPVIMKMRAENFLHPSSDISMGGFSFENSDTYVHKILENTDKSWTLSDSNKRIIYRLITEMKLDIDAYKDMYTNEKFIWRKNKILSIINQKFDKFLTNINTEVKPTDSLLNATIATIISAMKSRSHLSNAMIAAPVGAYVGKKIYDKITSLATVNTTNNTSITINKICEILLLLSKNKTYYDMLPTMLSKYDSKILSKYYVNNNEDILIKNGLMCDVYGLAS